MLRSEGKGGKNMGKRVEKRMLLDLLLVLLFLAAIPSVAFRAQEAAESGASSGPAEFDFGDGATVESVTEMLTGAIGPGSFVVVTAADGTIRESGPLAEGDIVGVFDSQGNLLSCVRYVRPGGTSSEPSSSGAESEPPPSSSDVPSSEAPSSDAPSSETPSSADPSGDGESEAPPAGGDSEAPGEDYSSDDGYYLFEGPATADGLRDELSAAGTEGAVLTIVSASGAVRQSGPVCTGDVLTVLNADGTLQYRVTAVIPGDLTRCGMPTEAAGRLLYGYLADSGTLRADQQRAADFNGDGQITTSDLLELKKILSSGN